MMLHRTCLLVLAVAGCTRSSAIADAAKEQAEPAAAKASVEVAFDAKLLDVDAANREAPAEFDVAFTTTKGDFKVRVHRDWAPLGADRFYNLVSIGYFDGLAFFRVVDGFMVQFGLHGVPKVSAAWKTARIADDKRTQSNRKGKVSFANSGPNTRTTQVFINFNDNVALDGMGFSPFGEVIAGMDVVEKLHAGYGDGPPGGSGPEQREIERNGDAYLNQRFPKLDRIERATLADPG